jgi:hypothetical protein
MKWFSNALLHSKFISFFLSGYKKFSPVIFLLLLSTPAFCQIFINRDLANSDNLSTFFLKQNVTWNWNENFQSVNYHPSGFNWVLRNRFNSSLINPDNSFKQWKDEHDFEGLLFNKYGKTDYGLYTKSWILIDKQQIDKNEFSNHSLGGFSALNIYDKVSIKPYLGVQRAKNISKTDWGWDTGISAEVTNQKLAGYNTQLMASADYDFFDTRKNYTNSVQASVATKFTDFTQDSLKVSFEESVKQFYSSTGEDIIEVKLYDRQITNLLFYQVATNKLFKMETNISSKDIRYFTDRKVFLIGSRFIFQHLSNNFAYEIDFKTSDENQNNSDIATNSRARVSALGVKTNFNLTQKNDIKLDVSFSKLQYDTPDENNDDRDEQRFIMDLSYNQILSPVLSYSLYTYGFLLHQIYLYSEQSINNNWNRVISFSPEIRYKNKFVHNTIRSTVLANYTDYDFDYLNLNRRSFLARRYSLEDSLSLNLNPTLILGINSRIQFEEKGTFFSNNFSQNIVQTYQSERINTFVTKNLYRRFILKAGYLFYKRLEWRHIPDKRRYREITNQGPFMNLSYIVSNRLNLSAYTSVSYIDDSRNTNRTYNNSHIRLTYVL